MREYVITLPLPSRSLMPNARFHWRDVAKAKRFARLTAKYAGEAHIKKLPPMECVSCEARFFFETRRKRDRDNLIAWLKSYFDGLQDSGLIKNDSDMTHLPALVMLDEVSPRVELHIKEIPCAS